MQEKGIPLSLGCNILLRGGSGSALCVYQRATTGYANTQQEQVQLFEGFDHLQFIQYAFRSGRSNVRLNWAITK